MWIVRIALRRPYTFVVMAMLIALGGVYSIKDTPTDIFPNIDIPVVSVLWNYGGLPPEDMEKRITNWLLSWFADHGRRRHRSRRESDAHRHRDHQDLPCSRVRARRDQAIAQTTAVAQSAVRSMPPGAVPPLILLATARPACRSGDARAPDRHCCPSSSCSTTPSTSCAPRSPRSRAHRSRIRTAGEAAAS